MKRVLFALLPGIGLLGCTRDRVESEPSSTASEPPAAKATPGPQAKPNIPPEARRNSAPAGMQILAEGAAAPPMRDLPSTAGPWSRSDTPTIVAFYRGFW